MTRGSSIVGGFPMGATLVTKKIVWALKLEDQNTRWFEGGIFYCKCAQFVFDQISNPDFLASVATKGSKFIELLKQKLAGNPHVKDIRGMGLIISIELDVDATPLVYACLDAGAHIWFCGKREKHCEV